MGQNAWKCSSDFHDLSCPLTFALGFIRDMTSLCAQMSPACLSPGFLCRHFPQSQQMSWPLTSLSRRKPSRHVTSLLTFLQPRLAISRLVVFSWGVKLRPLPLLQALGNRLWLSKAVAGDCLAISAVLTFRARAWPS